MSITLTPSHPHTLTLSQPLPGRVPGKRRAAETETDCSEEGENKLMSVVLSRVWLCVAGRSTVANGGGVFRERAKPAH